jgi:hypothetical protein
MTVSLGTINTTNLINQSWNNIYSVVNTISDPSNRGVSWVFAAFPQSRKGTTDVYPCIIIDSADMSGENIVFGHSKRSYKWTIPISIYATRLDTADGLASTVISTLETNKGSIESNGMWGFNIDNTNTFHNLSNSQVIHEKKITISCEGYI